MLNYHIYAASVLFILETTDAKHRQWLHYVQKDIIYNNANVAYLNAYDFVRPRLLLESG